MKKPWPIAFITAAILITAVLVWVMLRSSRPDEHSLFGNEPGPKASGEKGTGERGHPRQRKSPVKSSGVTLSGVIIWPYSGQSFGTRKYSDESGRVVLKCLAPQDREDVTVPCKGKSFTLNDVTKGKYILTHYEHSYTASLPVFVDVTGKEDITNIVISYCAGSSFQGCPEKPGSITGRITDCRGKPVQGAILLCPSLDSFGPSFEETSTFGLMGFGESEPPLPSGSISAQELRQACEKDHPNLPHCGESGRDGCYRTNALVPGRYALVISARGYLDMISDEIVVEEWTETRADFVLESGVSLAGRVVDAQGNPVAGACLWASTRAHATLHYGDAESALDGTFSLAGLIPADYEVDCEKEGFLPSRTTITAPDCEMTIVLDYGAILTGRVVRQCDGSPIENFKVFVGTGHQDDFGDIYFTGWGPSDMSMEFTGRTDGTFRFTGLRERLLWGSRCQKVTVAAEGYVLNVSGSVILEEGATLDLGVIQMGEGSDALITVINAENDLQVQGAKVQLTTSQVYPPVESGHKNYGYGYYRRGTTGSSGEVLFHGLANTEFIPIVTGEGIRETDPNDIETIIISATGDNRKTILVNKKTPDMDSMEGDLVLKGMILDGTTGLPIQGATVGVGPRQNTVGRTAVTDREGRFEVTGLGGGEHGISASHPDYCDIKDTVRLHEGAEEVVLRIEKPGSVMLKIMDPVGGRAAGFKCSARHCGYLDPVQGFTGSEGTCLLEGLRPGETTLAAVSPAESGEVPPARTRTVEVKASERISVEFIFGSGRTVSGIVSRGGEPVQGISIALLPEGMWEGDMIRFGGSHGTPGSVLTNESGEFRISDVQPGQYTLEAVSHAERGFGTLGTFRPQQETLKELAIEIKDRDVEINVDLPTGSLKVTVLDDKGNALPDCTVSLEQGAFRNPGSPDEYFSPRRSFREGTDKNGTCTFNDVGQGVLHIEVNALGFATFEEFFRKEADDAHEDKIVRMKPAVRIKGRVSTEDGRKPETVFLHILDSHNNFMRNSGISLETDSNGKYILDVLPAGSYTLGVETGVYSPTFRIVDIPPEGQAGVDFLLRKGNKLALDVRDSDGKFFEWVEVQFMDAEGKSGKLLTLIHDPVYMPIEGNPQESILVLNDLAPGTYKLRITTADQQTKDIEVRMTGTDSSLDIFLDKAQQPR